MATNYDQQRRILLESLQYEHTKSTRPANHLYDICSQMDYQPDGSSAQYGRDSHSPLRHPSPIMPITCCNHDEH